MAPGVGCLNHSSSAWYLRRLPHDPQPRKASVLTCKLLHNTIIFVYLIRSYVPLAACQEVSKCFTNIAEFNPHNKHISTTNISICSIGPLIVSDT